MRRFLTLLCLMLALCAQAQDKKNLRDSLRKAVDVLAYHPDSIDLLLKKASWNIELQEWSYAKDAYDRVLSMDSKNVAALYYRAYANEKLGRYNFARLDYESVLDLVPHNFEASLGLALLNQKDKHYTEAMDQMNALVEDYPDSAIAYAARGGIEEERGLMELAVYDYSEAIKRDPHNNDYLLNRVNLYLKLGKRNDAKDDLDELVRRGVPRASIQYLYRKLYIK